MPACRRMYNHGKQALAKQAGWRQMTRSRPHPQSCSSSGGLGPNPAVQLSEEGREAANPQWWQALHTSPLCCSLCCWPARQLCRQQDASPTSPGAAICLWMSTVPKFPCCTHMTAEMRAAQVNQHLTFRAVQACRSCRASVPHDCCMKFVQQESPQVGRACQEEAGR